MTTSWAKSNKENCQRKRTTKHDCPESDRPGARKVTRWDISLVPNSKYLKFNRDFDRSFPIDISQREEDGLKALTVRPIVLVKRPRPENGLQQPVPLKPFSLAVTLQNQQNSRRPRNAPIEHCCYCYWASLVNQNCEHPKVFVLCQLYQCDKLNGIDYRRQRNKHRTSEDCLVENLAYSMI